MFPMRTSTRYERLLTEDGNPLDYITRRSVKWGFWFVSGSEQFELRSHIFSKLKNVHKFDNFCHHGPVLSVCLTLVGKHIGRCIQRRFQDFQKEN